MITLDDVQRGYDAWAAKPHNAKWVRRIDGTPIANDIVVNIFEAVKDFLPQPAVPGEVVRYAERLAVTLWKKHWKDDAPEWKPLIGDLIGILTQIDNMTAGLVRSALPGDAVPAPSEHLRVYPQELTGDLRHILSMMMWNTGPIAHALRDGGQDIKRKAEDEQAEVLHWLIGLALEHGSEWRAKASDRIREIQAFVKAAAECNNEMPNSAGSQIRTTQRCGMDVGSDDRTSPVAPPSTPSPQSRAHAAPSPTLEEEAGE